MSQLRASLALAVTLATTAAAAAEDCDLQRAHWICVPNKNRARSNSSSTASTRRLIGY